MLYNARITVSHSLCSIHKKKKRRETWQLSILLAQEIGVFNDVEGVAWRNIADTRKFVSGYTYFLHTIPRCWKGAHLFLTCVWSLQIGLTTWEVARHNHKTKTRGKRDRKTFSLSLKIEMCFSINKNIIHFETENPHFFEKK